VTTLRLQPIDGKQPTSFDYQVANLDSDLALEFTLQDTDDVVGQEIHRIYIGSIPDKAPQINFRLAGIGTVVTPDVIMPYQGSIIDDFAVQRTWFQIDHKVGLGNPTTVELPFPMGSSASAESTIGSDQFQASIDFRDQRKLADGIKLAPQDQIVISVRAMDNCELAQGPNEGSGDRLQFDVVTPDELLTLLEAREISLRRRFEQMIEELTATRDSLLHVRADFAASPGALEPGDVLQDPTEPGDERLDPAQREQRAKSLRLIRVQEASAQPDKVSQEVLGRGGIVCQHRPGAIQQSYRHQGSQGTLGGEDRSAVAIGGPDAVSGSERETAPAGKCVGG
jgi:hypothetical protein